MSDPEPSSTINPTLHGSVVPSSTGNGLLVNLFVIPPVKASRIGVWDPPGSEKQYNQVK